MVFHRFLPYLIAACLTTILVFAIFQGRDGGIPWQLVGMGERGRAKGPTEEQIKSGENVLPDLRHPEKAGDGENGDAVGTGRDWHHFKEPVVQSESPYPQGKLKPVGSNYTKGLVIPRLKREDTMWIEEGLGDLMDEELLRAYVYTVNDPKAELRPPKNKGHEVMVYLSYIIDHYEALPDVSIFMHAHRYAWHNNELLNTDAVEMVRRLSPERVTRDGYMNLRCHWDPGCPAWLHPGATKENCNKKEEVILAECWSQLFPLDPIPTVLAQPCCAQFAVSRDRIQETPKMRYICMRDWILRTDLSDYLSASALGERPRTSSNPIALEPQSPPLLLNQLLRVLVRSVHFSARLNLGEGARHTQTCVKIASLTVHLLKKLGFRLGTSHDLLFVLEYSY